MAATVIFLGTYFVLAVGRIPGLRVDRTGAAIIGASLMVAANVLTLGEAYAAINMNTIVLLFGMMIVVANLRLSGFFALVGLALAAVGLYGVLTYSVVQRTREIGIRSALGAPQRRLVWMVLADTIRSALGGAVIGVAGGVALSRSVQSLLFEVTPLAFSSLALPLAAFAAVGFIAAVRPAWRTGRMDPAVALREE